MLFVALICTNKPQIKYCQFLPQLNFGSGLYTSFSYLLAMSDGQLSTWWLKGLKVGGAIRSAPSCSGPSDLAYLKVTHCSHIIKSWHLPSSTSGSLHFASFYSQKKLQFGRENTINCYSSLHSLAVCFLRLRNLEEKKKRTQKNPIRMTNEFKVDLIYFILFHFTH